MCLEVGRIDRNCLVIGGLSGQPGHDPRKHTHIAPPLPTVVECLGWAIFARRIAPAQPVAIDEYYAAQNTFVIDTGNAMALGKERAKTYHLRLGQPEQVAHECGLLEQPESH